MLAQFAVYPEFKLAIAGLGLPPPPVRIISSLLYSSSFELEMTWLRLRMDSFSYLPIDHSGKALFFTYLLYWAGVSLLLYALLKRRSGHKPVRTTILSMLLAHVILLVIGVGVLIAYTA
jgi:hypothetical protein